MTACDHCLEWFQWQCIELNKRLHVVGSNPGPTLTVQIVRMGGFLGCVLWSLDSEVSIIIITSA